MNCARRSQTVAFLLIKKSLGPSPDGIFEKSNHSIKIECPFSARKNMIKDAIKRKQITYLEKMMIRNID